MKISIITVSYNRVQTIEKTIQSLISQEYENIEYIVIDGNSNDGTQEIIEKYQDHISYYLCEQDQGMYDAINKGIRAATGEIIGLLHSDDQFYDNQVLTKVINTFISSKHIEGVYGNGIYISNDNKEKLIRNRIGGEYSFDKLKKGWLPLHTTLFIKKDLINMYGDYNTSFKIASDTEFILRFLYKHKITVKYLDTYIVKMKMGGLSTDKSRAIQVLKEDLKIYSLFFNNSFKVVFRKKLNALVQYFKK